MDKSVCKSSHFSCITHIYLRGWFIFTFTRSPIDDIFNHLPKINFISLWFLKKYLIFLFIVITFDELYPHEIFHWRNLNFWMLWKKITKFISNLYLFQRWSVQPLKSRELKYNTVQVYEFILHSRNLIVAFYKVNFICN